MSLRRISEGSPEPLGVTPDARGANVAVFSAHAEAIDLCLFDDAGERETARIRLPERTGDVFHGHVEGVGAGTRYGLRAYGPFAPGEGHRFNPSKLLLDPHARLIDRPFRLHPSMFGYAPGGDDLSFDLTDSGPFMPKAVVTAPAGAASHAPLAPWSETILYELHVRGFTKRHPQVPPEVQGTFAGLAHPAAIDHLVRLGITSVELLPTAAWIEERHLAALGLSNYWGYNPVAFAAPEPRLAPGGWTEIRRTVAALAEAGIETILDVVFNHSGEGDALGPTLSLRGLDNASYYRLREADRRFYVDDSGCGNTLALDRAPVVRLVMDSLRTWVREAGVHGFRFDLATALGRGADGFDPEAPLLAALSQDPELRGLKLIAEPWDIGAGGYQLGRFPAAWGEWNDRFRDGVRRFWRGEAHSLGELASRLAGSADLFGRARPPSRSVNFVTAHDGFTLADLVSHERKRNEANGEDNRDGCGDNSSWNCGVEGETDDARIKAARHADQRALLATLLFARGTPMLSMGAELGQSQSGNNNCYAQDNALSWLDWEKADPSLLEFARRAIAIRRAHPLLRRDRVLEPDEVAWLHPDGQPMVAGEWEAAGAGSLAMVLDGEGERLTLLFHRAAEPQRFRLPEGKWTVLIDSAGGERRRLGGSEIEAPGRSVLLLADEAPLGPNRSVRPETLRRLADEAGIQPVWWSVDGRRTDVGEDTVRHLLRAMRLHADSEAEARESLDRLAELYERPLPPAMVLREGEAPPPGLLVLTEDGASAPSGAALPPGRYRLLDVSEPEAPCRLTVAPRGAFLPEAIREGGRLWGVAAQLYSLRRQGDGGIGDFTTLAKLVRTAAAAGADCVGINPLHALFPEERERASPYSPSDRRFLDPIYLDTAPPAGAAAVEMVDYPAVWSAKEAALRERFAVTAFELPACPRLRTFATFCALNRHFRGAPWREWPAELRDPATPAVREFAERHAGEVAFHAWLQTLCEAQLASAASAASGMAIGLYRDLAVGAAPDGAEAWSSQALLAKGVSIGAPPDPVGPEGQVWNLPPFDPHALAAAGYDPFAELLRANMRHAGALRIDHAMALSRLFWVPDGVEGKDGAYVSYPLRDLLGEVALASVEARCMVVAEDLGTVPEGFREALAEADMLGYRLMLLEREGGAFRSPSAYPRLSLAAVASHDLPTFAGWWTGADIAEREALGLIDRPAAEARQAREAEKPILAAGADSAAEAAVAAHSKLAEGASALVMVQADDLALDPRAVNLPGTDTERPNWRRRLAPAVADLFSGDGGRIVEAVRRGRRRSAETEQPD